MVLLLNKLHKKNKRTYQNNKHKWKKFKSQNKICNQIINITFKIKKIPIKIMI